jgi:tripartite-type tricarboxylate transporter receptor subunit TctC
MSLSSCARWAACLLLGTPVPTVLAQEYPTKPIRIIVVFTPGTTTDILARLIGPKLTEAWGQQVLVDNRPGAAGIVGATLAAKAPPDGYTLLVSTSSAFAINPGLYQSLAYNAIEDFAPITNMVTTPQVIVASPSFAAKTVKDLIATASAKPGQLNYASIGIGSTSHLTMEMFSSNAGVKLTHVAYKGSPGAHTDIIAGQIPIMFDGEPAVLSHVKSGRLRALGIASIERSRFLPQLPTIAEQGYPNFEAVGWSGLVAPAKTPPQILDKINAEIVRILKTPDVQERLTTLAFTPVGNTREQYALFIKSEMAKWSKVIKDAGVKPE